MKEFDPTRLTVYESSYYDDGKRKYDYSNIDIYSRMYPPLSDIRQYLDARTRQAVPAPGVLPRHGQRSG